MASGGRDGEKKDYYFILGAEEDAPAEEIERRYKRLAVKHHPDRGGDEEEMKNLNEAYGVLGNREARDAYDAARRSRTRRQRVSYAAETEEEVRPPYRSPSAQADAFGGRVVGAVLFVAVGLVLLLLVRFQFMWFLWPLALLALFLVSVGVMLAHAAMVFAREALAPTHPARRFVWLQETAFWLMVVGGVYGVYLVMSIV